MAERIKNPLINERLGKPKDLDIDNLPTNVKNWIAEPKLDGLRGIIIKPKHGKTKAYTSNGIDVVNAQFICRAIDKIGKGKAWVLDGEFYTRDWNATQSLVMTQTNHPDAKKLCIRIFDAVQESEWQNKKSIYGLQIRKYHLERLVSKIDHPNVIMISFIEIKNTKKAILKEYNRMLKAGHEGLMLKDPSATYPFKRDKCWLRWKPKQTIDAVVIGVKAANKGKTGKYLGLIGSLQCKFFDANKKSITFNCSGMTDEKRKHLTKMHKQGKLIGKCVEVEHEGITVNKKVRFPQFVRERKDKD